MRTDSWLTKQQAADAIGVSTKLIEQFAKGKKLQSAKRQQPSGAWASVYHPEDVERLRKERNPDAPPFVVPPEPALSTEVALPKSPVTELLQIFASQNSQIRVPVAEKLYLTLSEAVVYSGLGIGYLRRMISEGILELLIGAGRHGADVVRRSDLEAHARAGLRD